MTQSGATDDAQADNGYDGCLNKVHGFTPQQTTRPEDDPRDCFNTRQARTLGKPLELVNYLKFQEATGGAIYGIRTRKAIPVTKPLRFFGGVRSGAGRAWFFPRPLDSSHGLWPRAVARDGSRAKKVLLNLGAQSHSVAMKHPPEPKPELEPEVATEWLGVLTSEVPAAAALKW